jgi:rRNA maturation protein Nop10
VIRTAERAVDPAHRAGRVKERIQGPQVANGGVGDETSGRDEVPVTRRREGMATCSTNGSSGYAAEPSRWRIAGRYDERRRAVRLGRKLVFGRVDVTGTRSSMLGRHFRVLQTCRKQGHDFGRVRVESWSGE